MPVEGYRASIVIREKESEEEARKEAEHFKHCPMLIAYGLDGKKIISVFMAPMEYEWWINYSELFPESPSETIMIKDIYYPYEPRKIIHADAPPCGANCDTCGLRAENNCRGCPALG